MTPGSTKLFRKQERMNNRRIKIAKDEGEARSSLFCIFCGEKRTSLAINQKIAELTAAFSFFLNQGESSTFPQKEQNGSHFYEVNSNRDYLGLELTLSYYCERIASQYTTDGEICSLLLSLPASCSCIGQTIPTHPNE